MLKNLWKKKNFKKVIDIGCGSGYKLIKYLGEYETIGYETEPSISFLKKTYPNRKWVNSGLPSKSFNYNNDKVCDLIISSDVIEHIIDPDELINYMKTFTCNYFIISTPCLEVLIKKSLRTRYEPPTNKAHIREWTFSEFKMYLNKHFNIIESYLGKYQTECQWHLCTRKK